MEKHDCSLNHLHEKFPKYKIKIINTHYRRKKLERPTLTVHDNFVVVHAYKKLRTFAVRWRDSHLFFNFWMSMANINCKKSQRGWEIFCRALNTLTWAFMSIAFLRCAFYFSPVASSIWEEAMFTLHLRFWFVTDSEFRLSSSTTCCVTLYPWWPLAPVSVTLKSN